MKLSAVFASLLVASLIACANAPEPIPTPADRSSPTATTSNFNAPVATPISPPLSAQGGPSFKAKELPGCEPSPSPFYCTYTVAAGDSYASIATRFGLKGTDKVAPEQLILESNHRTPPVVGTRLRVPTENGLFHKVTTVQSTAEVARLYGVPVGNVWLLPANGSANALTVGTEVFVLNPRSLPTAPRVAPPNRSSCAAIEGTPYESEKERGWFAANCRSASDGAVVRIWLQDDRTEYKVGEPIHYCVSVRSPNPVDLAIRSETPQSTRPWSGASSWYPARQTDWDLCSTYSLTEAKIPGTYRVTALVSPDNRTIAGFADVSFEILTR